jgi:hypothetical protein
VSKIQPIRARCLAGAIRLILVSAIALPQLTPPSAQAQLKFCVFSTGLHVVAVLKEEQFGPNQAIDDEYLMDEWVALGQSLNPDAVKLWRGHPKSNGE